MCIHTHNINDVYSAFPEAEKITFLKYLLSEKLFNFELIPGKSRKCNIKNFITRMDFKDYLSSNYRMELKFTEFLDNERKH